MSGEYSGFYTLSSLIFLPSRRFEHGRRRVDLLRVHRGNIYQLFGVGTLAHRGLLPFRGFVREVPLALLALHLSAREGCPVHCDTLTGGTFYYHLAATIFQWYQLLVSRLLNAAFLAIGQKAAPCQKGMIQVFRGEQLTRRGELLGLLVASHSKGAWIAPSSVRRSWYSAYSDR